MFVQSTILNSGGGISERIFLGWVLVGIISLWFFVSNNPFGFSPLTTYYNDKRLMQTVFLSVAALFLYARQFREVAVDVLANKILVTLWCTSLLFIALSAVLADNRSHAMMESLHWLLMLVVFAAAFYIARVSLSETLIIIFSVCYALVTIAALMNLGFEIFISKSLRPDLIYPSVSNHRFFNQVQVYLIPLFLFFGTRTRFKKAAYLLVFANLLLAFAGGSRGLLVSLAATGVLAYILLKPWRREIINFAFLAVVAYVVYESILFYLIDNDVLNVFRLHTSGRTALWTELSAALSPMHFIVGDGMGAYLFQGFGGHPHNSILQFLHEWGGVATISALGSIVWILVHSWKNFSKQASGSSEPDLQAALLVSVGSAAVYSLFSGVLVMPVPQTLFFIVLGLLLGGATGKTAGSEASGSSTILSVAGRALLFLVIVTHLRLVCGYFVQQSGPDEDHWGRRFWDNAPQYVIGKNW